MWKFNSDRTDGSVDDALAPEAGRRVDVGEIGGTFILLPLARVQPAVGRKPDAEADERDGRRDAGDDGQALVVAAGPSHRAAFAARREYHRHRQRVQRRVIPGGGCCRRRRGRRRGGDGVGLGLGGLVLVVGARSRPTRRTT